MAECEGVSAAEREAFTDAFLASASMTRCTARWSDENGEHSREWESRYFACCMTATWWAPASAPRSACALPKCPVCDPIGARKHDGRAIDRLARELWRARPDSVLAEMDRKLEAAELGGEALVALVAVGEQLGRCEAENERLHAELARVRDAAARVEAERDRLQDPYAVIRERFTS